ncbi:MAG: hypothetical protein JHD28_02760 [Bacteroidia bacterium]|nr:hypothetical protein [Bacteroidia bacterium]
MKGISFVVNDKNEKIVLDCWCRFAKTPTMAKNEEKVSLSKVITNLKN